MSFLQRREIGQHQLSIDHLDVANRINRAADVMDIDALKTAHHLHDRVDFTNVTEELVAETFACARAFHQPGYIDKLDRRRHDSLRTRHLCEHIKPRIRHGNDADVRIDRAKRIVRRLRFAGTRHGVKERRFTDVWQANDSRAEHEARRLRAALLQRNAAAESCIRAPFLRNV